MVRHALQGSADALLYALLPSCSSSPRGHCRADHAKQQSCGIVGEYTEELTAYLRSEYLRSLRDLSGTAVLLRSHETADRPVYLLSVVLPNDLLQSSQCLSALQIAGFIPGFSLESPPSSELQDWEQQTRVFDAAYQEPVRQRLLRLPRSQLTSSVAQFILFKVRTEWRVRK